MQLYTLYSLIIPVLTSLFQILDEIDENQIQLYHFPDCDSDDDESFMKLNTELKVGKSSIELKQTV